MRVLDDVERLLAKDVYLFDEESARQMVEEQKNRNVQQENMKVGWKVVPIKITPTVDAIYGSAQVDLTETHEFARLRRITITDLDQETLVLKPDNCGFRFYDRHTYNKACDYLLLTRLNDVRYAFFIDLKTRIYESQHMADNQFLHLNEKDEEIVWQMIGANTIFDSLISVLEKKSNTRHAQPGARKKKSSSCELSKFLRKYVVLYENEDVTGEKEPMSASSRQPNEMILDSCIYALKVQNDMRISLGQLVSVCNPN